MKPGFVPALATPLNENGQLHKESYQKQIEAMLKAGAVGVLSLGSMGQQAFLPQSVYLQTAKTAVETVAGRVPVFVGAMDCSIARAKERMAALEELDITAFVFTAPYYAKASEGEMMKFFRSVAAATKHGVMLYDLPGVTQSKITYEMVLQLLKEVPNFVGIKSADTVMFRKLKLNPHVPKDFIMVYSGLDTFDVAYKWGITNCLDGMLPVTPRNTEKLFKAMEAGDYDAAGKYLNNILDLRDLFVGYNLWPSYSAAMNMLSFDGNCAPDISTSIRQGGEDAVRDLMAKIGEI